MNKNVVDTIVGIIFIAMGFWFAIYHKSLGSKATYYQQKFWGLFHFKMNFSQKTVKAYQFMYLIFGISFAMVGFLIVFQIIKFK